jgi:hypothetical protein
LARFDAKLGNLKKEKKKKIFGLVIEVPLVNLHSNDVIIKPNIGRGGPGALRPFLHVLRNVRTEGAILKYIRSKTKGH